MLFVMCHLCGYNTAQNKINQHRNSSHNDEVVFTEQLNTKDYWENRLKKIIDDNKTNNECNNRNINESDNEGATDNENERELIEPMENQRKDVSKVVT